MIKNIAIIASLSLFFLFPDSLEAGKSSYFTMAETRSANLKPFPKWTGMRERFDSQSGVSLDQCDKVSFHPCAIKDWKEMIESLKNEPLAEQLKKVNSWANAHPYIVDQLNWGMEDYWETPHEFLSVSGDCEDYAIAKYYSLRTLGVPENALRIIIVQDLNLGGIIHAILGVYDGDRLVILDNQIQQVMPALKIYHYRPIYALNASSWWAYYSK
ncbi:MAG: transglutaminase-like cysteine peptidase [Alphaproteobacteria bacterium]